MEITAGSVGKGIAAIGGSGAGGYGIYALATEGKISDSAQSQESASKQAGQDALPSNGPDFLFQVTGFGTKDSGYDRNSFGYAFGRFMLNPRGKRSLWEEDSEEGNQHYSSFKQEFLSVEKANSKKFESLQQICEEVYKKPKEKILSELTLLYYTWQFCSVADSQPETVKYANRKDDSKYKGKWAGLNNNPDALFDASRYRKNSSDEKAWKHVYENVLKTDQEDTLKQNSLDKRFENINSGAKLGEECQKAYEYAATNDVTNYGRNVREYCVLDLSVTFSQYPTAPTN